MEQGTPSPDAWVVVRNCVTIQEAFVVRSVLEASEIDCLVPDEYLLGVRPEMALAIGGARVLVRSEDLEQATEALEIAVSDAGHEGGAEPLD